MKILRGTLTETRYDFPDGDNSKPMAIKSKAEHKENAVAYMADELGVHRVSNEGSDFAVSLHRRPAPRDTLLRRDHLADGDQYTRHPTWPGRGVTSSTSGPARKAMYPSADTSRGTGCG